MTAIMNQQAQRRLTLRALLDCIRAYNALEDIHGDDTQRVVNEGFFSPDCFNAHPDEETIYDACAALTKVLDAYLTDTGCPAHPALDPELLADTNYVQTRGEADLMALVVPVLRDQYGYHDQA